MGSSSLPERQRPGRSPFLFGLAPNGVCLAWHVTMPSGGLLPHRFTLTEIRRFAFCGAIRGSPLLGVTQRSALWSPDFPLRVLSRSGDLSDSLKTMLPACFPQKIVNLQHMYWNRLRQAQNAHPRKSGADSWGNSGFADHAEAQ